jgi:hypothetical protein
MKKKILVAGDLEGNFQPLLAKLNAFDIAFCVGRTLALNDQTAAVLNGQVEFSKPVYFVDNGPLKHILSVKYPNGGEIVHNFSYLGNLGIKSVGGFTVAFMSGDATPAADRYVSEDIKSVIKAVNLHGDQSIKNTMDGCELIDTDNEGVDILLTCSWPKNYNRFVGPEDKTIQGNELVEQMAYNTKPRYHFCANQDKYYERVPYINYDKKSQPIHFTRFICIGKLPQPDCKATCKYLYAFASQSLKSMTLDQIRERPDNCTENPYFSLSLNRSEQIKAIGTLLNEDEIFNEKRQEMSETDKSKIRGMTERVTLHIKGFSQYLVFDLGKLQLIKSMSSWLDAEKLRIIIWLMAKANLIDIKDTDSCFSKIYWI